MSPSFTRAANAYRNVGLETRASQHDQHQLVQMMFEGVLEQLNRTLGAMERRDLPAKIKHLNNAIRIIQEGLYSSLDLKNGGEISANLAGLYEYASGTLLQANLRNDPKLVEEVMTLIRPIAEAWAQIRNGQPNDGESAAPVAATATEPSKSSAFRAMTGLAGLLGGGGAPYPTALAGA